LDLGLVDGPRELSWAEDVGEVDERAGGGGDADAVVGRGVGVGGAVDVDAGVAAVGGCRHLGWSAPLRQDPPQRGGGPVTQRRIRTTGQHRRHRLGKR
jgi:hypothetical protein